MMRKNVLFVVLMLALVLVGCAEHEHAWDEGEVTLPPTCTVEGERTFTCEGCGATRTETIAALGHKWDSGKVTKDPTCSGVGEKTYTCETCKTTKSEEIPVDYTNGHKYGTDDICSICNQPRTLIESAEARIGSKYYATLSEAVKSLAEEGSSKTAAIVILKDQVVLENFSSLITSNQGEYSITFIGSGKDKTTIDINTKQPNYESGGANYINGAKLSFKDITVCIGNSSDYQGFVRAGELTFDSCAIEGRGSYWGSIGATFNNCIFNDIKDYNVQLYEGVEFVFNNCVFNSSKGKFMNFYKVQNISYDVTIKNCTFNNTGDQGKGKPVLNIKDGVDGYTIEKCIVSFEGNTLNDVAKGVSDSDVFQIVTNGDVSVTNSNTKITVDGKVVYNPNNL